MLIDAKDKKALFWTGDCSPISSPSYRARCTKGTRELYLEEVLCVLQACRNRSVWGEPRLRQKPLCLWNENTATVENKLSFASVCFRVVHPVRTSPALQQEPLTAILDISGYSEQSSSLWFLMLLSELRWMIHTTAQLTHFAYA